MTNNGQQRHGGGICIGMCIKESNQALARRGASELPPMGHTKHKKTKNNHPGGIQKENKTAEITHGRKSKPQQGRNCKCAPEKQTATIETLTEYQNISANGIRTERKQHRNKRTRNNVAEPSSDKPKDG